MRFSEYFKLNKTQPYLDFIDIDIETDIPVFLDPTALRSCTSVFAHECTSLLQYFFESVLKNIKNDNHDVAVKLLSSLKESNEFHLGFSEHKSRGSAFGEIAAEKVWGSFFNSKASQSGLLQDLEDTSLMIEGIGKDRISDAVCNIIREPLIQYTQQQCLYHGIPLTPNVNSGPIWNSTEEKWIQKQVSLPITDKGKIILIPKVFGRFSISYDSQEYYRHYVLPLMQEDELRKNSNLVDLLKDGRKRVTKKALIDKYGENKASIVEQTMKYPEAIHNYRNENKEALKQALTHSEIAELTNSKSPDWDNLITKLSNLPVGNSAASEYENLIEEIFTALFYPSLCHPTKQHVIHEGRKRIDISYVNEAKNGFFHWVSLHYPAAYIFIECKNYGKEVSNPEIDQIAGRFSPSRGQVGILACRSVEDKVRLEKRCIDTAKDMRGFIIALTDKDIIELIKEVKKSSNQNFPVLRNKFLKLIN